jgi:hypothetical protein
VLKFRRKNIRSSTTYCDWGIAVSIATEGLVVARLVGQGRNGEVILARRADCRSRDLPLSIGFLAMPFKAEGTGGDCGSFLASIKESEEPLESHFGHPVRIVSQLGVNETQLVQLTLVDDVTSETLVVQASRESMLVVPPH